MLHEMIFVDPEKNPSFNKHANRNGPREDRETENTTKSSTHSKGLQRTRDIPHRLRVKQRTSISELANVHSKGSNEACKKSKTDGKDGELPFSVLSNLIEENAHLKQINQKNLLKHSIQEAEEEILKVENSFGQRKSYMLTPQEIRNLCVSADSDRGQSKEIVKEYLEKRYGKLPSVFAGNLNSDQCVAQTVNLPYSGSSFSRNVPDGSKLPDPPSKWLY